MATEVADIASHRTFVVAIPRICPDSSSHELRYKASEHPVLIQSSHRVVKVSVHGGQPGPIAAVLDWRARGARHRRVDEEVVAIRASACARELRVDQRPQTRITTIGRGRVTTRRFGIPPTGTEPGVTYRDVGRSVDIVSGTSAHGDRVVVLTGS